MEEIFGQVCGVIIMIGCIVSSQLPKRWQILLGYSIINLFSSLNQLFVGAGLTSCFICGIATIHCAINAYKAKKDITEHLWEKIIFCILYLVAWGIGFAVSFKNGTPLYLDIMTLVATLLFFGQVFCKKERDIRLCILGNSAVYFMYDSINLNIAAVAKLFNIISVVIALIRYRNKDTKRWRNKL
jgi:hypothetical protein